MKHSRNMTAAVLLASGLFATGLAQAQSHSVANWSNPPGTSADSKAATKATPGRNATADSVDGSDNGKQAADAAANKGKPGKPPVKIAHRKAKASSKSKGGGSDSASATTPVNVDGASKGGAEATMQAEPSKSYNNDVERHAFDTVPSKK
jgi:hypothetical protein